MLRQPAVTDGAMDGDSDGRKVGLVKFPVVWSHRASLSSAPKALPAKKSIVVVVQVTTGFTSIDGVGVTLVPVVLSFFPCFFGGGSVDVTPKINNRVYRKLDSSLSLSVCVCVSACV